MDVRREILGIPQALRDTLEKGRPEYEALVRKTPWGEGPIYIVGCGSSLLSGLTAGYAFESMLGWPVVTRSGAVFRTYTLPVLRPRSVLLMFSSADDSDEMVEAARSARSRGVVLLAMTSDPASPVAKMADGAFLLRTGEESALRMKSMVCRQAAISVLALLAARTFKRHEQQADRVGEEFEALPERVEWVFTQLSDVVDSFASELKTVRNLRVVGGGFYHPIALKAALVFNQLTAVRAEGFESSTFIRRPLEVPGHEAAELLLSGTRCRLKREIHEAARLVRKSGGTVLSITDNNDSELTRQSRLAVTLPVMSEVVGSVLTLALLEWVGYRTAREQGCGPN